MRTLKYDTWPKLREYLHPVPSSIGSDCLEWIGCKSHGYGVLTIGREERWRVHRLAWTLLNGAIPEGRDLHHKCENKACCNVDHLEIVTGHQHHLIHDPWDAAGRKSKTHCVRGHEFTLENTLITHNIDGRKRRRCIACNKIPVPDRRPVAPTRKKSIFCKRGHEYTAENTVQIGVYRSCLKCGVEYRANWHQENKERRNKAARERHQINGEEKNQKAREKYAAKRILVS